MKIDDKTRTQLNDAIYTQLCEEIRYLSMFEMLAAKRDYEKRIPLNRCSLKVQDAIHRIGTAAISKLEP